MQYTVGTVVYTFTVILEKDLCESKCIEFELYQSILKQEGTLPLSHSHSSLSSASLLTLLRLLHPCLPASLLFPMPSCLLSFSNIPASPHHSPFQCLPPYSPPSPIHPCLLPASLPFPMPPSLLPSFSYTPLPPPCITPLSNASLLTLLLLLYTPASLRHSPFKHAFPCPLILSLNTGFSLLM